MSKSIFAYFIFLVAFTSSMFAAEGMWILPNVPDAEIERMEENGLEIELSRIYNEKSPSIKDAVVYLTSGYTGTIISDRGLLIAPIGAVKNRLPDSISHHGGYKSPSIYKEVPLKNLGAWILQSTQDVTCKITMHTSGIKSESRIKQIADSVSQALCRGEILPQGYIAKVEATSTGNYYLYVYKCFNDVRLVYMPPSTIANDTLKKERHSADFVVLRIYSNRNNEPSLYDNTNMTYNSVKATIAEDTYKEGDFVLSLGFPNKTDRDIFSAALNENISRLETKNSVYQFFDTLKYANLQGKIEENKKQYDVILESGILKDKKKKEYDFLIWAANHPDFQTCLRYGNVVPFIDTLYVKRQNTVRQLEILTELLQITNTLNASNIALDINDDNAEELFDMLNTYFVEYDDVKEREIFVKVLNLVEKEISPELTKGVFELESTKYKGDRAKYVENIFDKSIITDEKRFVKYLDSPTEEQLKSDILVSLVIKLNEIQRLLYYTVRTYDADINHYTRLYKEGLALVKPLSEGMPDANYTLRLSSGLIKGYDPDDVTHINAVSTIGGLYNYCYTHTKSAADTLLTSLYTTMPALKKQPITFLTDLDMAIGRTGYGVYDYNGELLGMVIDWNRESSNNQFVYTPEYHRFVVLDIKYMLFILDKYASLDYVIREISK